MHQKAGQSVVRLGLDRCSIRRITTNLAEQDTSKVFFGRHARQRMREHGVTIRQVFDVMRCRQSYVTEGPCQTPAGSWKFNLLGFSAGNAIELVIDMKGDEPDLSIFLVTVIVK